MLKHFQSLQQKYILILILMFVIIIASTNFFSQAYAAKIDLIGSSTVADIAEAASSKVVWITTTYEQQRIQNRNYFSFSQPEDTPAQGFGSGFFLMIRVIF